MALKKILFELSEDWHGSGAETLWAEEIEGKQFRLDNTPFYVKNVSCGDVVTATEKNGFLVLKEVVKRGGHSTYRIIIDHSKTPFEKFKECWGRFSQFGCTYEGGPEFKSNDCVLKLYAIDLHPEANIDEVYAELEKGESNGLWEFEEGHCYKKGE